MQLTLRTMLAYLDEILDPADARELGKKIEDSEFASELVHRIRSVTRKLRLGAPKLAGRGMGLDANTVAEYLDNTLPRDRFPDFEKVCLESDVQLAEVAACHQILTLVLGEPADVDPALRERIRSLQARLEGATRAQHSPVEPAAPHELGPRSRDQQAVDWDMVPSVPVQETSARRAADAGRSIRWMPIFGTLVVAFLLALVALIATGPLDHRHPILGRLFAQAVVAPEQAPSPAAANPADSSQLAPDNGAPSADRGGSKAQPSKRLAKPPVLGSEQPATSGTAAPAPVPTSDDLGGAMPKTAPGADDAAEPPAVPSEPAAEAPTAMNDPQLTRSKLPPEGAPDDEAVEEPAPPPPLAQYISDQQVLARFQAETRAWWRVATNDPVNADTRLVALPTYRPQILFSSGVQLTLIGPAEVSLTAVDAEGVPGIVVQYGRLIAMPVGQPKCSLNIQFGTRHSRVTFDDLDAQLALDARHCVPAGADPQRRPANWVLGLFTPAGKLSWQDQGAATPTLLEPGQLATLVDSSEISLAPLPQLPDWLDLQSESKINLSASKQLEPLLDPTQPLIGTLREQVNSRMVEVRTLAIRSLSQFDDFDPAIDAINSGELRTYWKDIVESLRAAQTRSPDTAKQVQAALGRLRGEEGAVLDRLLWRFSPEQLALGGGSQLVEALNHPSICVRVLAHLNLSEITGKTNGFQPEREPRTQRPALKSWERDLQQHEIKYAKPPTEWPEPAPSPKEGEPAPGPSNVP